MFNKAKYIIGRIGGMSLTPVVFPEYLTHADIARDLRATDITGAGFVKIGADGKFYCWGESVSLKVKSHDNDSDIMNRHLGAAD